jgi:hypothetical protein
MKQDAISCSGSFAVVCLALGSLLFFAAWVLMPGVGVTDTATIFALIGRHRSQVMVSVGVQLLSAAAYAPGVVGLLRASRAEPAPSLSWGAVLLAIGAMGSAADAIFHLVAYEMTAPGVDTSAMVPVMQALQGPDLMLLAPMIVAFFAGHGVVAWSSRKLHELGKVSWLLTLSVPLVLVAGAAAQRGQLLSARALGLTVLALVSLSLPLAAVAQALQGRRPPVATSSP